MEIINRKIIIATHYLVYGAPQALRDYLMNNKIKKLLFIAHPLQIDGSKSYIEIIIDGVVLSKKNFKIRSRISFFNYFLDVFSTFFWIILQKDHFDLFVGVDCLNCLVGIILKKIGKVKKTIFYTIDYVPERFRNKFLNNFYHWLDKICVKYADETWNLSQRMAEGREKIRGLNQKIYNRQKIVPIGVWFDKVKRLPFDQINKRQLFFLGNLSENSGVHLVLDAICEIVKELPDFHFLVVGGGEYEKKLRDQVVTLNLEQYITFTGWIKDRNRLDEIMADSAMAIAMYNGEVKMLTYYADPTKLKDYLSAGLPILLTNIPHNAQEIQNKKCGFIVEYNKDAVVQAILSLCKDEDTLRQYRDNAINYSRQFDWNIIFKNNLERVL
ncbi:MAG: glycosyltransferase [Patescibacteria group bacterium]|jgi:glycosyltransferase involved in cell wall biosynthesis